MVPDLQVCTPEAPPSTHTVTLPFRQEGQSELSYGYTTPRAVPRVQFGPYLYPISSHRFHVMAIVLVGPGVCTRTSCLVHDHTASSSDESCRCSVSSATCSLREGARCLVRSLRFTTFRSAGRIRSGQHVREAKCGGGERTGTDAGQGGTAK